MAPPAVIGKPGDFRGMALALRAQVERGRRRGEGDAEQGGQEGERVRWEAPTPQRVLEARCPLLWRDVRLEPVLDVVLEQAFS